MPDRLLACWCSDTANNKLAVLALTPELAAILRARHAYLVGLKPFVPQLLRMEYDNIDVRFFCDTFNNNEAAVAALFAAAESVEEDDFDGWFELAGVTLPPDGDYRTGWESLTVGEHGMYWSASGKHTDSVIETYDILPFLTAETPADGQ